MSEPSSQTDIQLPPHSPWQPQSEPPRRSLPNRILALVAAVFTAAAVGTWLVVPESRAEAVVRSFLEDVRDGEVESALEWLAPTPRNPFLTAEALDPAWEITEVAQVAHNSESAEVYAEIAAFDGTRLGHRFTIDLSGDTPHIENGRARTAVNAGGSIEINGFSAEDEVIRLLPGLYRFFESAPPTLDLNMPPVLVLGDRILELGADAPSDELDNPRPELTDSGARQLDIALRALIDDCARTRSQGCPLGLRQSERGLSEADPQADWRIIDYPTAVIDDSFDSRSMQLSTTEPGIAEFDALVHGTTITVTCPIWVEGLAVRIGWDSGVVTVATDRGTPDPCDRFAEAE